MRKSFGGLVRSGMKRDPLSGDLFVFVNRRRTHVKLLVWDRSGFVFYYKRLERGTFELPAEPAAGALSWPALMLILEVVSLKSVHYRKRYAHPRCGQLIAQTVFFLHAPEESIVFLPL
jgi:hypothetical protein